MHVRAPDESTRVLNIHGGGAYYFHGWSLARNCLVAYGSDVQPGGMEKT